MIARGNNVKITHQIVVNGRVAFEANDIVLVESISPNPQKPENRYVVFSTKVNQRFQLSDADVQEIVSAPEDASPANSEARTVSSIRLVVGLLTMLLVIGASYFGERGCSVKHSPIPATQNAGSPASMSMAEFNAIRSGMSYEQVAQIVGGPGDEVSEAGNPGESYYLIIYKWDGVGSLGAKGVCWFHNGKLTSKTQFGLQ